jgi:DNA topoisomerase-2
MFHGLLTFIPVVKFISWLLIDFINFYSPLTSHIFNKADEAILNFLYDDNQRIEPEWYIPILPMVLVNGADGIGTGWMTKVPNHNPREIVENIRRLLRGEEPRPMVCV